MKKIISFFVLLYIVTANGDDLKNSSVSSSNNVTRSVPTDEADLKNPSLSLSDNSVSTDEADLKNSSLSLSDNVTRSVPTDEADLKNVSLSQNVSQSVPTSFMAPRAERVSPSECPYYVSIQIDGRHTCGGALISQQHVLTAAHCVEPIFRETYASRQVIVEVGSVVIQRGKSHAVKRLAYSQNYQRTSSLSQYIHLNDIAVITLKTPVQQSANVRIINLPAANYQVPIGAHVKVSGFGNAHLGGPTSNVLKKSDLYIISSEQCDSFFYSTLAKRIDPNSQVCASGESGYGACQGDSGGPMVYNNQVVGLVSAGDGNCGSGNPDIYTKVSSFISFIQSELNGGNSGESKSMDLDSNTQPGQHFPSVGRYPSFWPRAEQNPIGQNPYYPTVIQNPASQAETKPSFGEYPSYYPDKEETTEDQNPYYPTVIQHPINPIQINPSAGKYPSYYPGQDQSTDGQSIRYPATIIHNPVNSGIQGNPAFIQIQNTQSQYYPTGSNQYYPGVSGQYLSQYLPGSRPATSVVSGQYGQSQISYFPSQSQYGTSSNYYYYIK